MELIDEFIKTFLGTKLYNNEITQIKIRHQILIDMYMIIDNKTEKYDIDAFLSKSYGHRAFLNVLIKHKLNGKNIYNGPLITKQLFQKLLQYTFDTNVYMRELFQSLVYELLCKNKFDYIEVNILKTHIINYKFENLWRFNIMLLKPTISRDTFFGSIFGEFVGNSWSIIISGESYEKTLYFSENYIINKIPLPMFWTLYNFGQIDDSGQTSYNLFEKIKKTKGELTIYNKNEFIQIAMLISRNSFEYITYILDHFYKDDFIKCIVIALKINISVIDLPFWYDIFIDTICIFMSEPIRNSLQQIKNMISLDVRDMYHYLNTMIYTEHRAMCAIIYSFSKYPDNFDKCIATMISCNQDKLSICCSIVGALCGSRIGFENIPKEWVYAVHNLTNWNFDTASDLVNDIFDLFQLNKVRLGSLECNRNLNIK